MLRAYLIPTAALVVLSALTVPAQTAQPSEHELTLEEVAAAAHIYFRDAAQFPMLQHTVMTVTNSSGRVRKHHEGSYDYLVEGYSSGKHEIAVRTSFPEDFNVLSAIAQAWNGTLSSAIANNVHAVFPANLLLARQAVATLTVVNRTNDGLITARLGEVQACPPFAFSDAGLFVPRAACGESEVQLRPDLSLQRFVFEEGSLPAAVKVLPFGKTILQSFRIEIEFQEVVVDPDPQPYIVPESVTSTLVTAKGTLSMVSTYTADGPGTLKKKFSLQARENLSATEKQK